MALKEQHRKVCILSSVHVALDSRIFYREARSLRQAGYDVTLIAVHERNEVRDGVQILALPRVPRWQRPRLWLTLFRHALASRADIFHFHDPELLLIVPWLHWLTGKPTIYDVHEVYADFIEVKDYMPAWLRYPMAWCFRWLEPLLVRLQSAVIFANDQVACAFRRLRRPKTTLFNYPARAFVENAVLATGQVQPRPPIVLHLGGHERNRGTRLMVEAFYQVLRMVPEARLILLGPFTPPSLEDEVRADIGHRGIEGSVSITGRLPFEQIGEYLKQAAVGWVALQPVSKNMKSTPTKLFEYMAYGVPIVCSDLLSTRPFVRDGENGYLVAADDPCAHADAILRILHQPNLASAMGKHGHGLVQTRYNWDEMERRLLSLYNELLS
jgi:glycosyltransferase involved in cell wall biosynthesis